MLEVINILLLLQCPRTPAVVELQQVQPRLDALNVILDQLLEGIRAIQDCMSRLEIIIY